MQKITPFLWFDGNAEAAMKFYVSLFKNSKITDITRLRDKSGKEGNMTMGTFKLAGQKFHALNGGPQFKFSPALSFFVRCKNQREINRLWTKLRKGGQELQCGWVTDRFGVTWQIVPDSLGDLLGAKNPKKSARVWKALMKMVKIDLKKLERAYEAK